LIEEVNTYMALSVSIAFFFGVSLSFGLWARLLYKEERKSAQRNLLLIQAFRSEGW
jgi:hypothetical protein